jgi:mannitol/fructose-specific phosphotransferase system IIA component (Ntr-type)
MKSNDNAASLATLADFTSAKLIVPHLKSRKPSDVIKELCQLLYQEGCVTDLAALTDAVFKRESMTTTAMDNDLALPHARIQGLKKFAMAFGRSDVPLTWVEQQEHRPVHLVFLMAVPEGDATQHLQFISGVSRLYTSEAMLEKLRTAATAADIFAIFKQVSLKKTESKKK